MVPWIRGFSIWGLEFWVLTLLTSIQLSLWFYPLGFLTFSFNQIVCLFFLFLLMRLSSTFRASDYFLGCVQSLCSTVITLRNSYLGIKCGPKMLTRSFETRSSWIKCGLRNHETNHLGLPIGVYLYNCLLNVWWNCISWDWSYSQRTLDILLEKE